MSSHCNCRKPLMLVSLSRLLNNFFHVALRLGLICVLRLCVTALYHKLCWPFVGKIRWVRIERLVVSPSELENETSGWVKYNDWCNFSDEGDTCGGVLYKAAPRGHIVKFRFLPGGGIYGIAWEKKVSSRLAYAHCQVSVLWVRFQSREILVLNLEDSAVCSLRGSPQQLTLTD